MTTATSTRMPRINPVMREEERVTPLELFFDLVFVLAITQCTTLMSEDPTWGGIAKGILILGLLWWAYFDVVALVAARRLEQATVGRQQNEMARDSYSLLHFPMVAGVVLFALGMKKTLGDVSEPLKLVPAFALVGGLGIYLLAHVAFRYRNLHSINKQRLLAALVLFALLPVVVEIPALVAVMVVTTLFWAMISYEAIRFAEGRERVRHQLAAEPPSP